jgi:hypothetical protein
MIGQWLVDLLDSQSRQQLKNIEIELEIARERLSRSSDQDTKSFASEAYKEFEHNLDKVSLPTIQVIAQYFSSLNDADLFMAGALHKRSESHPWQSEPVSLLYAIACEAQRLSRTAPGIGTRERSKLILAQACERLSELADAARPPRGVREQANNSAAATSTGVAPVRRKRSFILVHGTWPRGAIPALIPGLTRIFGTKVAWFDDGSEFRTNLSATARDNIEIEITKFEWSGNNSVLDRADAASKLAAHLKTAIDRAPNSEHVVIGHSHGGNVILRAMYHLEPDEARRFLLVTLATPFVQIYRSYVSLPYLIASLFIYVAIPSYFIAFTIKLLLSFGEKMPTINDLINRFIQAGLFSTLYVAGWYCISLFCLYRLFGALKLVWSRRWNDEGGDELIEAANYKITLDTRILILRGVYDEAALALATGSILTLISRFLRGKLLNDFLKYAIVAMVIVMIPKLGFNFLACG